MTNPVVLNPYGGEGNKANARRMRRSFRLCVFAAVLVTVILWFSERFLGDELTEVQYTSALTLAPESGRTILRQVVKRDAIVHETPTVKYLQALAEREEKDLVLPVYQQAHQLDPTNSFLAIRYGCQLFGAGRYPEAAACFRRAAEHPPRNALAEYLEAAALAFASPNQDLTESVALAARANENDAPVLFPEPLWSEKLPTQGYWYHMLRRAAVDDCLSPIYAYVDLVVSQAKPRVATQQVQSLDAWLQTLQTMGKRLLDSPTQSSLQAVAGVRTQLLAVELRRQISAFDDAASALPLEKEHQTLAAALDVLNTFEGARDRVIESDKRQYTLPLKLAGLSLMALWACYTVASLWSLCLRAGKTSWDLPHSKLGLGVMWSGTLVVLLLLIVMSMGQDSSTANIISQGTNRSALELLWWGILAGLLLFGVVYPMHRLPRPSAHSPETIDPATPALDKKEIRHKYWIAYCSFVRRYYGILTGLIICAVAIWAIGYRLCVSSYPWQNELLVSGLSSQEAQAVSAALALLH